MRACLRPYAEQAMACACGNRNTGKKTQPDSTLANMFKKRTLNTKTDQNTTLARHRQGLHCSVAAGNSVCMAQSEALRRRRKRISTPARQSLVAAVLHSHLITRICPSILLRRPGYAAAKWVMGLPMPGLAPRKMTCGRPVLPQVPRRSGLHCRFNLARSIRSMLPDIIVVDVLHSDPKRHWSK